MSASCELSNGLRVSIDWLSFTVTDTLLSVNDVISLLGFDSGRFMTLDHGSNGYKSALKLNGFDIRVLFDGNDDMGIHVDISGSSIPEAMNAFKQSLLTDCPFGQYYDKDFDASFLASWLSKIRSVGHFTRVDLAVDDLGCNFFSTDDFVTVLNKGLCVSKFRTWENLVSSSLGADCVKTGHTIYLGAAQSDFRLRVYDKQLEQKMKTQEDSGQKWVRWELQLRRGRADQAAIQLINKDNLGSVCVGVLSNSLRMIENDDSNRSRCSVNPLWQKFIDGIARLSLYVAPLQKSIDRMKNWVRKQVAPSIASLYLAESGDIGFFQRLIDGGLTRLNRSHVNALDDYNPRWRDRLMDEAPLVFSGAV